MNEQPIGYTIICRHCSEENTLQSVSMTAAWYLLHSVKEHWEMVELLRSATPETIAAAIAAASADGWLEDIKGSRD